MSHPPYFYDGGCGPEPNIVFIPVPVAPVCCCSGAPPNQPILLQDYPQPTRTRYDDLVDSFVQSNWQALHKVSKKRPKDSQYCKKEPKQEASSSKMSPTKSKSIKIEPDKCVETSEQDTKPPVAVVGKLNKPTSWASSYMQKIGQSPPSTFKIKQNAPVTKNEETKKKSYTKKSEKKPVENNKMAIKEDIDNKTIDQFAPIRPKLKFVIPKLSKLKKVESKIEDDTISQLNTDFEVKNKAISPSSQPLDKELSPSKVKPKVNTKSKKLKENNNLGTPKSLKHVLPSIVKKIDNKVVLKSKINIPKKIHYPITKQNKASKPISTKKELSKSILVNKTQTKSSGELRSSKDILEKYKNTTPKCSKLNTNCDDYDHEVIDLRQKLNEIQSNKKSETTIQTPNPSNKYLKQEQNVSCPKNNLPELIQHEHTEKPSIKEVNIIINIIHNTQNSEPPTLKETSNTKEIDESLDFLDDFNIDDVVNYLKECEDINKGNKITPGTQNDSHVSSDQASNQLLKSFADCEQDLKQNAQNICEPISTLDDKFVDIFLDEIKTKENTAIKKSNNDKLEDLKELQLNNHKHKNTIPLLEDTVIDLTAPNILENKVEIISDDEETPEICKLNVNTEQLNICFSKTNAQIILESTKTKKPCNSEISKCSDKQNERENESKLPLDNSLVSAGNGKETCEIKICETSKSTLVKDFSPKVLETKDVQLIDKIIPGSNIFVANAEVKLDRETQISTGCKEANNNEIFLQKINEFDHSTRTKENQNENTITKAVNIPKGIIDVQVVPEGQINSNTPCNKVKKPALIIENKSVDNFIKSKLSANLYTHASLPTKDVNNVSLPLCLDPLSKEKQVSQNNSLDKFKGCDNMVKNTVEIAHDKTQYSAEINAINSKKVTNKVTDYKSCCTSYDIKETENKKTITDITKLGTQDTENLTLRSKNSKIVEKSMDKLPINTVLANKIVNSLEPKVALTNNLTPHTESIKSEKEKRKNASTELNDTIKNNQTTDIEINKEKKQPYSNTNENKVTLDQVTDLINKCRKLFDTNLSLKTTKSENNGNTCRPEGSKTLTAANAALSPNVLPTENLDTCDTNIISKNKALSKPKNLPEKVTEIKLPLNENISKEKPSTLNSLTKKTITQKDQLLRIKSNEGKQEAHPAKTMLTEENNKPNDRIAENGSLKRKAPIELKVNKNKEEESDFYPNTPITDADKIFAAALNYRLSEYQGLTLLSVIHRGQFSTIFKFQRSNGKQFSAKVYSAPHIECGEKQGALMRELLRDIPRNNQNCVFLISSVRMPKKMVLLLEYFPCNLKQFLLKQKKSFKLDTLRDLSRQLLSAVLTLRNCNIVHSDIKPSHILINATGDNLKLTGFESAYYPLPMNVYPNMGSINYRAPEIIIGYSAGYSIDVWSAAVVMYEMATGRQLFPGLYNNDILFKQMSTLGHMPWEMIANSYNASAHFRGMDFLRRVGKGQKRVIIHRLNKSNRLESTLLEAYETDWAHTLPKAQREKDQVKLKQFYNLLRKMLAIHPRYRLAIEFAYSSQFIYQNE